MTDLIKDASASHFSRLIVRKVGSNNDLDYIDFDYLIAADGANSFIRNKIGISLKGKAEMQTLLNVHFSCPGLRELLHPRPAMLYFVFNEVEKIETHFLKQTILLFFFSVRLQFLYHMMYLEVSGFVRFLISLRINRKRSTSFIQNLLSIL